MPARHRPVLALTLAVAVVVAVAGCGRPPEPRAIYPPIGIGPRIFEDATAAMGLRFQHDSGSTGEFKLWETLGSGAALLDFDNDGRLDVYLVQGGGPRSPHRNQLFHQTADGRFEDVSAGSGLDVAGWGMGTFAGDVTNDGLVDVVVTEYGATRLFQNQGHGKFQEITTAAGLDNPRWATAASFLDFDRDGWLDLVVVNYLDYDPSREGRDPTGARDFCRPQDFPGTVTRLYRNLGRTADGQARFVEVSVVSRLALASGPGLGVYCADFDGDHWPDIFVANDGQPNRLFVNHRDGTFRDEAIQRGLAYNALGASVGNRGIAAGDANGDGLFDLFVTHPAHEPPALWKQGPRGLFQDQAAEAGLVNQYPRGTGFGAVLADFDDDGTPDLAIVNGHVLRENAPGPRLPGLAPFWSPYAQRAQLFRGDGNGKFQDVSDSNPAFSAHAAVGRGLAMGDLDGDGDLDLLATCAGGPARVFRNVSSPRGHWLSVRAIEPGLGGRDAIGAEITVVTRGGRRRQHAQPSSSFLVSHDPRVHFGLGDMPDVEAIEVRWPDGSTETFPGVNIDQAITLRHGSGTATRDEGPALP